MYPLFHSIVLACSVVEFVHCVPGSRNLRPRGTPTPDAISGTSIGALKSDVVITTTLSSTAYTLTYAPLPSNATISKSPSTTDGWHLVPPIVPLPFPAPAVVPPPTEPEIPEGDGNTGEDDNENDDEPDATKRPAPTASQPCSSSTAISGVVNCTEIVWVSSYVLQSSLSGCSTFSSTASGCSISITTGMSTTTVDPYTVVVTASSDSLIEDEPGPIFTDPTPPDDPNLIPDIFANQLHIAIPPVPPRGTLTCAAKNQSGPSFSWKNANSNINDFCGNGTKIEGNGISKNYTQPNDGSVIEISATYAVNDTCPAGGTTQWDDSRCKYLLNRPLLECEPDGQAVPSPPMYGGSILADCVETTITPLNSQTVVCGAFDNGGGMGFKAFTAQVANDAIDKYCNSDNYTADPNDKASPFGTPINGYARDRFWYKDGTYCTTTSPRPPPPNIPADQSVCKKGMYDYEIDVGVQFDSDQAGCQPKQAYVVPRGQACVAILGKVANGCSLDAPTYGGRVEDDSDYGCLQWWLYASGSQF